MDVLQEYLIDEAVGVSKTEFLARASSYYTIHSDHVLPLQALFFSKVFTLVNKNVLHSFRVNLMGILVTVGYYLTVSPSQMTVQCSVCVAVCCENLSSPGYPMLLSCM